MWCGGKLVMVSVVVMVSGGSGECGVVVSPSTTTTTITTSTTTTSWVDLLDVACPSISVPLSVCRIFGGPMNEKMLNSPHAIALFVLFLNAMLSYSLIPWSCV